MCILVLAAASWKDAIYFPALEPPPRTSIPLPFAVSVLLKYETAMPVELALTCRGLLGLVVPIPTLPAVVIVALVPPLVFKSNLWLVFVPTTPAADCA
jgi:hypothetical protein